jgi:hypothetical protein
MTFQQAEKKDSGNKQQKKQKELHDFHSYPPGMTAVPNSVYV